MSPPAATPPPVFFPLSEREVPSFCGESRLYRSMHAKSCGRALEDPAWTHVKEQGVMHTEALAFCLCSGADPSVHLRSSRGPRCFVRRVI